jgi:hypothetical protein
MGQRRYGDRVTNIRDESPPGYVIPLSLDGTELLSFEPSEQSGWAVYFPNLDNTRAADVFIRVGPPSMDVGGSPSVLPEGVPLEIREVRVVLGEAAQLRSAVLRSIPQDRIEAAINQPKPRKVLAEYVKPAFVVAESVPGRMGAWLFRPPEHHGVKLPDLRLEIPDGYRKPDEFYSTVGELFLQLAAVSTRAAQEIAEANEVKPTTVHRWIREAKARGLLVLPSN